jgi:hypothetical protein
VLPPNVPPTLPLPQLVILVARDFWQLMIDSRCDARHGAQFLIVSTALVRAPSRPLTTCWR